MTTWMTENHWISSNINCYFWIFKNLILHLRYGILTVVNIFYTDIQEKSLIGKEDIRNTSELIIAAYFLSPTG